MRQLGVVQDRVDAQTYVDMISVHEAAGRRNCCSRGARAFPLASRHGAVLSYDISYDGMAPSHRRSCDERRPRRDQEPRLSRAYLL
jgi:hypothetical protein